MITVLKWELNFRGLWYSGIAVAPQCLQQGMFAPLLTLQNEIQKALSPERDCISYPPGRSTQDYTLVVGF